ncbi:hypothetical protein L1987_01999 [Smallanthus sonchifolius]|uniref:Uncharacterized protein n=1 Tax=Smallanthus sonchifolius TaxID=185202 RepID=A0ACB9K6H6_9ASTR|nr:hypothetical protein L1987_01999 [Smallanthus sonchifolius]
MGHRSKIPWKEKGTSLYVGDERVDSNRLYLPYQEIPNIPVPRAVEEPPEEDRVRILLNQIAELEREKAETKAENEVQRQALEDARNRKCRKLGHQTTLGCQKKQIVENNNNAEQDAPKAKMERMINLGIEKAIRKIIAANEENKAAKKKESMIQISKTEGTKKEFSNPHYTRNTEGEHSNYHSKTSKRTYWESHDSSVASPREGHESSYKKRKNLRCSYKNFQDYKTYEIVGKEGTVAALRWLEKTNSVLAISKFFEEDKVLYASNLFRDHTLEWWNQIISTKGVTPRQGGNARRNIH